MTRVGVALIAMLLLGMATIEPARAQRDGGANPRQGGAGARAGGDGGFRGAGGGQQGRGGQGAFGRGRGNQVQGTSVIRGLVTAADTNTPLRRAQITANSPDTRSSRAVSTDANGRFELTSLPAGRWTLTASKGGFVSQQYGQRRSFEAVEPIDLSEGQRFNANFTLPRGGVITGRIADEFGDAITGARVEVLRSQMTQGRRRLAPVSVTSQTDDTGAFRVYGLAPGEYYVAARLQPMAFDPGDGGPMMFAPTYYPGTGSVADAQPIRLEAATEQSGVNFVLLPVRSVRVSGSVADANGAPVQAMLSLATTSLTQGPFGIGGNSRSLPDGTFTIQNVSPGEYVLEVTSARGATNAAPDVASIPLVVGNEDLNGVTIVTSKGGTIKGTVTADNGTRPQAMLQVTAQSLGAGPRGFGGSTQVSSTGTFELTGLVGSYVLRVDRIPDGWMVKSITVNGREVSDAAFDVRGSDQLVARVVLSDRVNELTGTVRSGGQAATNASVVVFPDDPAQWAFPSRRVRTTRVDKTGLFRVRALPAGQRYLAIAVDYLEQGEFQDPEFLQRMKAKAMSVTLGDGEMKNIDLPLIER